MDADMKAAAKHSKPVVISYLRFSRPEQLKGDSIRRQLALGDEWAKRNKMKIADTFRDLGISAFRGKNAAEGALSQLLALIDSGRIPRGSVLLIEQLDRLSRNALLEALELFLSIIRRGIKVVTLMDGMEYDRESLNRNMQQLMYSLMQMSLAHEESAKKSERLAHAWDAKRQKMKDRVLTKRMPAWLRLEGGKIVIDKEKAAVVRRMVKLVLDGHGLTGITKKLNAEFNGLARVNYFNRSYTTKIAHNRALVGEFQPHKLTYQEGKRVRVPVGEPIKGYYPALIDEKTWYAMQQRLASRRSTGGRNRDFINLFVGLLHDAGDGSRMQIIDKGGGRRYVSSAALLGRKGASDYIGFPVDVVERAVLLQLHNAILPRLTEGQDDDQRVEADALEARIAEVDRKIDQTQALMLGDGDVNTTSVVTMLAKLDKARKKLAEQLDELRGQLASRGTTDIDAARALLADVVTYYRKGTIDLDADKRVALRNIIRLTIERIDAKVSRMPRRDLAAEVTIKLRDGEKVQFTVFAYYQNQMKRNALGHPIKSDASGKLPVFKIGIGEPAWLAVRASDGETEMVASTKSRSRVFIRRTAQKLDRRVATR